MNYTQRPYHGEADLPAMLALKQLCTTPQNLYDRPTTGEMRRLLAPPSELTTRTSEKPSWQEAIRGMPPEHRYRALTQRLTALWEDASGQLVAYALIAQPGSSLTFQVLYWLLESSVPKTALRDGERSPFTACKHRRVGVQSEVVNCILMQE